MIDFRRKSKTRVDSSLKLEVTAGKVLRLEHDCPKSKLQDRGLSLTFPEILVRRLCEVIIDDSGAVVYFLDELIKLSPVKIPTRDSASNTSVIAGLMIFENAN